MALPWDKSQRRRATPRASIQGGRSISSGWGWLSPLGLGVSTRASSGCTRSAVAPWAANLGSPCLAGRSSRIWSREKKLSLANGGVDLALARAAQVLQLVRAQIGGGRGPGPAGTPAAPAARFAANHGVDRCHRPTGPGATTHLSRLYSAASTGSVLSCPDRN